MGLRYITCVVYYCDRGQGEHVLSWRDPHQMARMTGPMADDLASPSECVWIIPHPAVINHLLEIAL